jgi:ATP-binding cassette subfamily C protein
MRCVVATLARKRTVVLIAHRKGVLDKADRLLVLENGRPRMLGPAAEIAASLTPPSSRASA